MEHVDDVIGRLAQKAAAQPSVTISIPRDHPQAGKLLKLAAVLSKRQVLSSGIVVEKTPQHPRPVEAFIDAIREVVGNEVFDAAMRSLATQHGHRAEESIDDIAETLLGSPALFGTLLHALGSDGHLAQVTSDQRQKILNATDGLGQ